MGIFKAALDYPAIYAWNSGKWHILRPDVLLGKA